MLELSLLLCAATCAAPALARSEVVFMGTAEPAFYRAYGGSFVSWGGTARSTDPAELAAFVKRAVTPARAAGMRYSTGLAFRTAFAGMIDYEPQFLDSVTRDLDGQPIKVPWLWDHQHKGHPAYWFCTNAPGYRRYLRWQAERAAVRDAAGKAAEGLHIDDYNGTAGCPGGCFCPSCMTAFTAWLRAAAGPAEVQAAGVTTLDGFSYAAWLKAKGITAETVRTKRWTVPLNDLYQTFQLCAARDFVAEIRRYSEQLRSGPVLLSVNSSATSADHLVIAPVIDYFCGEVDHHAARDKVPDEPVFVARMADALGKGAAWTASGWDWAYVYEKQRPGLVRTWIAQSYAAGHSLMACASQWCYTKEKGTHWYRPKVEEYSGLYRFVRDRRELFDGYEAADGGLALVYSNPAFRRWRRGVIDAAGWLTRLNRPFRLVLAGDDWLAARLTADNLRGWRAVLVQEPTHLTGEQAQVLAGLGARALALPDKPDAATLDKARRQLDALCPPPLTVTGAHDVVVMPRRKDGAPLVLHLLNRNYDPATDACTPQTGFQVKLSAWPARRATLYAPGEPPRALTVTDHTITVDRLNLWAVVTVEA